MTENLFWCGFVLLGLTFFIRMAWEHVKNHNPHLRKYKP